MSAGWGGGVRGVSRVQGDGGGGRGASAMFEVMGEGEGRQPCRHTR